MIPSVRNELLDKLICNVIETDDEEMINRGRSLAYFLIDSQEGQKVASHCIDYWCKKWKSTIRPEKRRELIRVAEGMPRDVIPIYNLLDKLKNCKNFDYDLHDDSELNNYHNFNSAMICVKEEQILYEIIKVYKGKKSELLILEGDKFRIQKIVMKSHLSLMNLILKYYFILKSLNNSSNCFKGTFGAAGWTIIEEESQKIMNEISMIELDNLTLLKLYSFMSMNVHDRIMALSIICSKVNESKNISFINEIININNYENFHVKLFSSQIINSCISILLKKIRNWVAYGVLDDKYSEFFIQKQNIKIEYEEWWNKKYLIQKNLIPSFFTNQEIIKQIFDSGKAIAFIRKNRNYYSLENTNNFAPLGINIQKIKDKKINYDIEWEKQPFELSMIPEYYNKSINSLMYMIKNLVWIKGHLQTIHDFILFGRGDFANVLYFNFYYNKDDDPSTLLLKSINQISNSKNYTNKIKKEILTYRIEIIKTLITNPKPNEIELTYVIDHPFDIFIDKQTKQKYDIIGRLIWKLKCYENRLSNIWLSSKKIKCLSIEYGFKPRKLYLLRYLMNFTIKTISEYLSIDIIFCKFKKLQQKIEQSLSLDDMIKLHQEYLNYICDGIFQTDYYLVINESFMKVLNCIGEYSDIIDDIEIIHSKLVFSSNFIHEETKELKEIENNIAKLYKKFNEEIHNFYLLITNNMKSKKIERLKSRFHLCVLNLNYQI